MGLHFSSMLSCSFKHGLLHQAVEHVRLQEGDQCRLWSFEGGEGGARVFPPILSSRPGTPLGSNKKKSLNCCNQKQSGICAECWFREGESTVDRGGGREEQAGRYGWEVGRHEE